MTSTAIPLPVDPVPMVPSPLFVDALAQEIRRVDGNHSLGAGALAEALAPFLFRFGLGRAARCETCGRAMDVDGDLSTRNCGGDCLRCMAQAGDSECSHVMQALAESETARTEKNETVGNTGDSLLNLDGQKSKPRT